MNERMKRIKEFERFSDNAKEIFGALAEKDDSNKRLANLFSLCICPGGRFGGTNKKELEVFYGNRPIDHITIISHNSEPKTKLEIAKGATLAYYRTDDGNVVCNLYPAKSQNQTPPEEVILLEYIKRPEKLSKRAAYHWKMFIAYMEVTCIDGDPSIFQRLRVFYLRNFKQYITEKILRDRKCLVLFKEVFKYVLTIGLSGFLILVFTLIKNNIDDKDAQSKYQKVATTLDTVNATLINISQHIEVNNIILQELIDIEKLDRERIENLSKAIKDSNETLTNSQIELRKSITDVKHSIHKQKTVSSNNKNTKSGKK